MKFLFCWLLCTFENFHNEKLNQVKEDLETESLMLTLGNVNLNNCVPFTEGNKINILHPEWDCRAEWLT